MRSTSPCARTATSRGGGATASWPGSAPSWGCGPRIDSRHLGPALLDGDHVAIHWRFEFTPAEGPSRVMEEIAWQRWEGDRVVEERFFYNPAQVAV